MVEKGKFVVETFIPFIVFITSTVPVRLELFRLHPVRVEVDTVDKMVVVVVEMVLP